MPPVDYMKVLDIAALTLESNSHIEVDAVDLKIFNASVSRGDGSLIEIRMRVNDYDLELSLNKKAFNRKEFSKWLAKFEYQLEQSFFKNISIDLSETKNDYKIKVQI